jgi:hypothetical protein
VKNTPESRKLRTFGEKYMGIKLNVMERHAG